MQNTIKYASTIITWQWYKVSAESVSVCDVVTMKGTLATPATILRHMVPVPTLPLSFGLATLMQLDVQWEIVLVCLDHDAASGECSWWIESEEIIWKVPCTIFPNLVFSKIKLAAVDWGGKNLGGQVRSDSNYENQCHFLSIHALDQGHRTFIQRIHESLKTKLLSIIICSVWNDGSPRCCNITGVWWPRQSNQRVSSLRDVNSSRCHQFNQFIILSWSSWVSKRVDA